MAGDYLTMNMFVFEHLCSGCAADDDLSPELTPMGLAMLTAIMADFQALGVHVSTMLDHRISVDMAPAAVTRVNSVAHGRSVFETLSAQADYSLIIAPESDGLLESWINNLQARSCRTLNSSLQATHLCADKFNLSFVLEKAGIATPVTHLFQKHLPARFPVVVKPRWGAGSEWTFVCHDQADFEAIPQLEDWIIQPLVKGVAASCAVMVVDGKVTPLAAGVQMIEGNKRLHYRGGRLPLDSPAARDLARRAVSIIPGAAGYLGVDMILGDDPAGSQDVVIEINPRLSMSYLGLRALCEQNLAAAMLGRVDPAILTWRPGQVRFNRLGQIIWETTY
jgi:predicted ATP-grasp superfamily ATP-dependent carboligase